MREVAEKVDQQLADALKVDARPLLAQHLDVVEKVDVAALEHHLLLGDGAYGRDALEVGQHCRLLDVHEEEEDHESDAVCGQLGHGR